MVFWEEFFLLAENWKVGLNEKTPPLSGGVFSSVGVRLELHAELFLVRDIGDGGGRDALLGVVGTVGIGVGEVLPHTVDGILLASHFGVDCVFDFLASHFTVPFR